MTELLLLIIYLLPGIFLWIVIAGSEGLLSKKLPLLQIKVTEFILCALFWPLLALVVVGGFVHRLIKVKSN